MNDLLPEIRQYLVERGWDTLRPSDIAKSVSIEAAELLQLFQWESLDIEETLAKPERMEELKKELGDVMIYCLEMCILLGLDANEVVRNKLALAAKKYPATKVKEMEEKLGRGAAYLKVNRKHWEE